MGIQMLLLPFLCATTTSSIPVNSHPNRVINLPGAPLQPEFPIYSGFLNASSDGTSRLFYILVESIRVDPSTAPLVIWFNGGPGGSSLGGFFMENGPYRVTENGSMLTYNEYSWNQYANVLYLESPVGVGFSHSDSGEITTDDESAAENNFIALKDFMTRVHPNYSERNFYLTGQSYAGAYVPWFSRRILRGIGSGDMEFKYFKGFAIGSPVFTDEALHIGQAMYFLSLGILPQNYTEMVLTAWMKITKGEDLSRSEMFHTIHNLMDKMENEKGANYFHHSGGTSSYNIVEHCANNTNEEKAHNRLENGNSFACYAPTSMKSYLRRKDVQSSLHIENVLKDGFNFENINMNLYGRYNRTADVLPIYNDIIDLLKLTNTSFRMLIYHGDTDAVVPVVQTIQATSKIAQDNHLVKKDVTPFWHFFYDYAGGQTKYRSESRKVTLDVLTVRGAGHSAPQNLPAQSFQMINNFIFTEDNEQIDYNKPI